MTTDDDARGGTPRKGATRAEREARLAEALRANLRKRKARARARRGAEDRPSPKPERDADGDD